MEEEKLERVNSAIEQPKIEEKKEGVENKEDKYKGPALADGWLDKPDWIAAGKDPEEWRPAREYVERGELFTKIESQNKELKQLRKVLDTLKQHHLNVKQEAMEDAIAILKRQRDVAKKEEDLGKVLEITEEIDSLKDRQQKAIAKAQQELQAAETTAATQELSPAFKAWHAKNKWYVVNGDDPMTLYANGISQRFIAQYNGKVTEQEVLDHVDRKVKEKFPDAVKEPNTSPKVESAVGSRETRGNSREGLVLTETEQKIMNTLVKSGVMTKEQYLKEIKKYEESH